MEFATSLLQLVKELWGLASKPLGYIYNLKDNVDSLRKAIEDLKAVIEDVKARVEREEKEKGAERTKQVENWLVKVEEFVGRVEKVLREAEECDRIKCLSRCLPRNCKSSYRLGKRVDRMLNEAREQKQKGEFGVLTSPLPPPPALELHVGETMGLDVSLNKVLKWFVDEKVGVIGLYGAGGVGKTTLMKRINQELLSHSNHEFEVVIWVVVSKQVNEYSIQDAIRKRLHIEDESWARWSRDERVHHLYRVLTPKKFVLLIDDVWQRLDLSNIGVPHPSLENGSKVVFTTRSKQVCDQMKADKTLEVQCLTQEEALKLFEKNVGKSLVDFPQEIQDLAKDIAEECKGLPLALITVGAAVAGKENPGEWRHALTTLRNKPHKLRGMVEEVYHILEFSYNSLIDSTLQLCFLYCCLFPEDFEIRTDELIELWIGEGLLGDTDDVYSMRDEGESLLGDLKRACLLESGFHDERGRPCVKMHDVIRDMATWIARDHGQEENKLLVIEKEEEMLGVMISKWVEAEKVSLWGQRIQKIDGTPPPQCSKLKTLLVRGTEVSLVPRGFFDSMKACLTVLNLSNNRYMELFPQEICDLINLRYLNLSSTRIRELPREIKNLTRLRWLLLDDIGKKIVIPTGAITSLPLNVFSRWRPFLFLSELLEKEEEIVEELGCMQHLTDLSIMVSKISSASKIFASPNFRRSIRRVAIAYCEDLTRIQISQSPTSNGGFPHLEVLRIVACLSLVKMEISQGIGRAPNYACFPSLVEVHIHFCGLSDLSWLVHAPKLRELTVDRCHSMERIIGGGFTGEELAAAGLFSRLETLSLSSLPKLTSICDRALFFPQWVSFDISGCPGLRKLPLDSNSARGRSFSVQGDAEWWAKFEWEPTARVTLQWKNDIRVEEMTYGEAAQKIKDDPNYWRAKIGFLPGGPE